jgi:hypothetical protein
MSILHKKYGLYTLIYNTWISDNAQYYGLLSGPIAWIKESGLLKLCESLIKSVLNMKKVQVCQTNLQCIIMIFK